MDGCEPPCVCWDLNSGPSEKQSVLLTAVPSLQPHVEHSYSLGPLRHFLDFPCLIMSSALQWAIKMYHKWCWDKEMKSKTKHGIWRLEKKKEPWVGTVFIIKCWPPIKCRREISDSWSPNSSSPENSVWDNSKGPCGTHCPEPNLPPPQSYR
jgi:hypothetical protein